MATADELKSEGNELYKQGKCKEAIQCYSKAIALTPKEDKEVLSTLLKNRAAAYLKTVIYCHLELYLYLSIYLSILDSFHLLFNCREDWT
jgi:tetratricopeptide (TPR) repeat protein